jgi:hypothetical protein
MYTYIFDFCKVTFSLIWSCCCLDLVNCWCSTIFFCQDIMWILKILQIFVPCPLDFVFWRYTFLCQVDPSAWDRWCHSNKYNWQLQNLSNWKPQRSLFISAWLDALLLSPSVLTPVGFSIHSLAHCWPYGKGKERLWQSKLLLRGDTLYFCSHFVVWSSS